MGYMDFGDKGVSLLLHLINESPNMSKSITNENNCFIFIWKEVAVFF